MRTAPAWRQCRGTARRRDDQRHYNRFPVETKLMKLWREYRGFAAFIVLMVVFRSALADWNVVPTGSMKPTILEGDRILVNKLAYDLHIPLTHVSVHRFGDPQRGDIV